MNMNFSSCDLSLLITAGKLIVLKYPYPREVEENPDYHSSVTAHFLSNPPKPPKKLGGRCQSESEVLSNSSGEHSLSSSVEEPPSARKDTPTIHSVSVSLVSVADLVGVRGVHLPPFHIFNTYLGCSVACVFPTVTTAFGGFVGYAHYLEPPFPNF